MYHVNIRKQFVSLKAISTSLLWPTRNGAGLWLRTVAWLMDLGFMLSLSGGFEGESPVYKINFIFRLKKNAYENNFT